MTGIDSQSVTADEVKQYIQSEVGRRAPSPEAGKSMWNPQEELLTPLHSYSGVAWGAVRPMMLLIMLAVFSATIGKEVLRVCYITDQGKKDIMSAGYDV